MFQEEIQIHRRRAVSLLWVVRNESFTTHWNTPRCLSMIILLRQNRGRDSEKVVVDNGWTDEE